jgi:hypothetical protein
VKCDDRLASASGTPNACRAVEAPLDKRLLGRVEIDHPVLDRCREDALDVVRGHRDAFAFRALVCECSLKSAIL